MSEADDELRGIDPESIWSSRRALMIIVVCLILLGLAGMGVTALFAVNQREYAACQRGHNDEVTAALNERAKASDLDRVAIRGIAESGVEMLKVLLDPASTQQQRIDAVGKWQTAQTTAASQLTEADNKRQQSPLPPPRQC